MDRRRERRRSTTGPCSRGRWGAPRRRRGSRSPRWHSCSTRCRSRSGRRRPGTGRRDRRRRPRRPRRRSARRSRASSLPSSALTRAAAALIRPSQWITGAGIGCPETGKFSTAFAVSRAPELLPVSVSSWSLQAAIDASLGLSRGPIAMALAIAPRLGAIPALPHRAPGAGAVARVVVERPATVVGRAAFSRCQVPSRIDSWTTASSGRCAESTPPQRVTRSAPSAAEPQPDLRPPRTGALSAVDRGRRRRPAGLLASSSSRNASRTVDQPAAVRPRDGSARRPIETVGSEPGRAPAGVASSSAASTMSSVLTNSRTSSSSAGAVWSVGITGILSM